MKITNKLDKAINSFHTFLSADLYSKFKPEHKLPTGKNSKMESWYREDIIRNEKEFDEYLDLHFKIFRKEIEK
jgi:hypothetical protein